MTNERVERRLAAILAADVAGYSRLMGDDEEGTLVRLKAVRKAVVDPKIERHRGRIVKTTGDGLLVEFASAVDAGRCAIEVQAGMAEQNAGLPRDKRIEFRIGIHIGDIIIDDNDIFGDGVNIAARLEGIAPPGGICISDDAHRQIRGKIDSAYNDMGLQVLKNIVEPMRAWRVLTEAKSPTSSPTIPLPEVVRAPALPDKPSIAVLPFQNMSSDLEQEYLADGIVEDIITALSRFKSLFVIARNSSFTYKGRAVDVKQVGRELGVRYVLEGSVRKASSRVRITGQLIDAISGAHLWGDRFDGDLEDIFDLQDKVTQKVIGAITPELDRAEMERASRRSIGNIDAVTEHYRGLPHAHWPSSPVNNDDAFQHFTNAIAIDAGFASAYGGAAMCLLWRRVNYWPTDVAADNALLLFFYERVKELNSDEAFTLAAIGMALFHNHLMFDAGLELVNQAIKSNPNYSPAYHCRGYFQAWHGKSDTAIADFEQSMRLSPRDPFAFSSMIGIALGHYNAGRYEEAASWAGKSIRAFPYFIPGLQTAVLCYVGAGKLEDARSVMAGIRRMFPEFSLSKIATRGRHVSPEISMKYRDAFLEAGCPKE